MATTTTKKASSIFEEKRDQKSKPLTPLENQVGTFLQEAVALLPAEQKKAGTAVAISSVREIPNGKEKPIVLIFLSYKAAKVLLSLYVHLVNHMEKKLSRTVVFLSHRKIESRWIKKNRTQKRANSRTLTAVYAAYLDELIYPSIIIGHRTHYRLDGTSFMKLAVDASTGYFLENRVNAIRTVYKRLTTRDIEISFEKDPVFYTKKAPSKKTE